MDIGTLTGAIVIEDKLSDALTSAGGAVKRFADSYLKNLSKQLATTGQDILELTKGTGLATEALGVGLAGAAGVASVAVAGVAVAATAAIAGIAGLTTATILLGNRGSDVNDVAATFQNFAGTVDNANATLEAMRRGTLNTVTDFELMKDASKLMAGGVKLSADNFGTLTQAAFVLQNQGLGPTKDMLELLSNALLTGQTRLLQRKIGLIDTAKAEKDYADAHNVEKLNRMQKAEADRIAILDAMKRKVAEAGAQQRDFGESMEAAVVAIKNWGDRLASAVAASPSVLHAVDAIGDALSRAFGVHATNAVDATLQVINKFADGVAKYGPMIINTIGSLVDNLVSAWKILASGFNTYIRPLFVDLDRLKEEAKAPTTGLQLGNVPLGGLNLPPSKGLQVVGFGAEQNKLGGFLGPGVTMGGVGTGVADQGTGEDKFTDQQKAMEKLTASAVKLTEAQKNIVEQFRAMGKPTELVAKAFGINSIAADAYADQLDFVAKQQEEADKTAKDWARTMHGIAVVSFDKAKEAARDYADVLVDKQGVALKALVDYKNKNEEAAMSTTDVQLRELRRAHDAQLQAVTGTGALYDQLSDQIEQDYANQAFAIISAEADVTEATAQEIAARKREYKSLGDTIKSSFLNTLLQIPQIVQNAFTGGGGVGGAIQGVGSALGASLGSVIGNSILPGIGGAIGSALGSLVGPALKGLGKLFGIGPTEYEKRMRAAALETRNLQDQLIKTHGSMQMLIVDADLVGINIKEAFKWQDPAAFSKIVDEVNAKTQLLNSAMQEYGFTWEDLGEKARGAKLADLFDELYAKTDVLRTAGIDYHEILTRQAKDYSDLVQAALRTGTEIPQSMQKTLEDLLDMGLLLDENGEAFKDLSDVKWAKTLTQGFDEVKDALYEVRDAILYGLGGAMDAISQKKIKVQVEYDTSGAPGVEPQHLAGGGRVLPFPGAPRGSDTVPIWATPGETVTPEGRSNTPVVIPITLKTQTNEVLAKQVVKTFVRGGL